VHENGIYGYEQWEDDNYDGDAIDQDEHDYPVCYTCSNPTTGDVILTASAWITAWGNPGNNYKVRATGTIDGQTIHLTQALMGPTYGNGEIWVNLRSDEAIPNYIADGNVVLNWQVSINGGNTWKDVGTSTNRAYLTWRDPTVAAPYETCVYIGCHAANGLYGSATSSDVITFVWTLGFAECNVTRVDSVPLHYYQPWLTDVTTTAGLIASEDGQCLSWACLFIDTLKAQGLYTNYSDPNAPTYAGDLVYVTAGTYAEGFLVKNWSFGMIHSGLDPDFPYINIFDPAFSATDYIDPNTNSYKWYEWNGTPLAEVTDQTGVGGQNSSNPQSLFNNHRIVKIVSKDANGNDVVTFYDPSYGVTYTSLANMEATAIAGYLKGTSITIGSTEYDGLKICQNDLGDHLVASYSIY
jgi:hypothetical protein